MRVSSLESCASTVRALSAGSWLESSIASCGEVVAGDAEHDRDRRGCGELRLSCSDTTSRKVFFKLTLTDNVGDDGNARGEEQGADPTDGDAARVTSKANSEYRIAPAKRRTELKTAAPVNGSEQRRATS